MQSVHCLGRAETVAYHRDTLVGNCLRAVIELHVLHIGAVGDKVVDVSALDPCRAHQHVGIVAAVFLYGVYDALNYRVGDGSRSLCVRFQPFVSVAIDSVQSAVTAENRAETGKFVFVTALHRDVVAFCNRVSGNHRAFKYDFLVGTVNAAYATTAHHYGIAVVGNYVNDHAFEDTLYAVKGKHVTGHCRHVSEDTLTVAEKHTTEVEFCRADKVFHFVFQKAEKCAAVARCRTYRLVRHFDCAVQVFEGKHHLLVIVFACRRQITRFGTEAAVDTVADNLADFLAPHVGGSLFKFGKQRVDFCVK